MTLSPLVERELRTGARRTLLFWLRGLLALILGAQCYDLLRHQVFAPPGFAGGGLTALSGLMTGSILLRHMATLLYVALLLMGLLSADSISRERREGTLGLLLLTDLTPFQVVYGKMITCGLNSFLIFLGALPVLMVPVLIGGVTGGEAVITGLGLLNTLFVALAAGLWMSANFRERRHAVGMTLAVVAALGYGSEVLGGNWLGPEAAPLFRVLGLGGWKTLAQLPGLLSLLFVPWFVIMNSLGWLFLYFAGLSLSRNWQDKPHRQAREIETSPEAWPPAQSAEDAEAVSFSPNRPSWLTVPRPWDASPVGWRVLRMGPIQGLIWLAVAINFVGQFCAIGSGTGSGRGSAAAWGLMSFGGLVVVLFSGGFFAWAGARFFLDAKRQQDLELILTTSVGSRTVLSAQWDVLLKALKLPLALVLLIAVPSGISFFTALDSGYVHDRWSSFPTFIIPINLALEIIALCWMGMYCGLRAQTLLGAVLRTIGQVQFAPFLIAIGVAAAWDMMTESVPSPARIPIVVPMLLFLLVKNVAFVLWARFRLRQLLRLKQRSPHRNVSNDELIAQPA